MLKRNSNFISLCLCPNKHHSLLQSFIVTFHILYWHMKDVNSMFKSTLWVKTEDSQSMWKFFILMLELHPILFVSHICFFDKVFCWRETVFNKIRNSRNVVLDIFQNLSFFYSHSWNFSKRLLFLDYSWFGKFWLFGLFFLYFWFLDFNVFLWLTNDLFIIFNFVSWR